MKFIRREEIILSSNFQKLLSEKVLNSTIENIEKLSEPLLAKIEKTFPEYTKHDIEHSRKIISIFDWLIPESLKEKLNKYEIFFLIASAFLHDIGMVNFPELMKEEDFNNFREKMRRKDPKIPEKKILQLYIRENHHLRSEMYINAHFKDFTLENKHLAYIIGRICRGHRKEDLFNDSLFDYEYKYLSYSINTQLLASLLRIADELDLTFERVPSIIDEHIILKDPISKLEWEKLRDIGGVGPSLDYPHLIKCSATCENSKIHRALKSLESKVNRELTNLPCFLHHYRVLLKDFLKKFLINITPIGYIYVDFKFSLKGDKIIKLLMGERLYKHKEECLRELLKNSVDACRYRKEILKEKNLEYNPEINFQFNSKRDRIIIKDNGIGMDKYIIESFFTKIGETFYQSSDFLEKGFKISPLSELGLGILSCFMIATKISILTKMDNKIALEVEIEDISDYFIVKESKKEDTGTIITLFLKENIGNEINLVNTIRNYAKHIEFPIKINDFNDENFIVVDQKYKTNFEEIERSWWDSKKYSYYSIKINEKDFEGIIAIVLEKRDKFGLVPAIFSNEMSISMKEGRYFHNLSYNGIFISNINVLPNYFNSEFFYYDINLIKNILDLNLSRNDVIENQRFRNFKKNIETIILTHLIKFLDSVINKNPLIEYFTYSNKFLNQILRSSINNTNFIGLSEEFRKFFKDYCYLKTISRNGVEILRLRDILKLKSKSCFVDDLFDYDEKQVYDFISKCSSFSKYLLFIDRPFFLLMIGEMMVCL